MATEALYSLVRNDEHNATFLILSSIKRHGIGEDEAVLAKIEGQTLRLNYASGASIEIEDVPTAEIERFINEGEVGIVETRRADATVHTKADVLRHYAAQLQHAA